MLKTEQKYRYNRETENKNKKTFTNKGRNYSDCQQLAKNIKYPRQYQEQKHIYKEKKVQHYYEKQNRGMNELSPKNSTKYQKDKQYLVDDVDSLSQIRFMSKECSSIKENIVDIDCNSQALSRNQLQDFSPLFERIQKNSSDDFILEIEDITQSQPSIQQIYEKCQSVIEINQGLCKNQRMIKSGKIKKNKFFQSVKSRNHKFELNEVDKQIQLVFISLDLDNNGILTKNNCKNQNLSTELNYFIGSILTKIKVKGKKYNFAQFKKQFDILIKDSEPSELNQIFGSNKLRKKKMEQSLHTEEHQNNNFSFQQNNKQNQLSQRLSRIDEKLVLYLQKNHLTQRDKFCSDYNQLDFDYLSSTQKQEQNKRFNLKNLQDSNTSDQILQRRLLSENNNLYNKSQQVRSEISLRNALETIRGIQGGQFQLSFTQLNKHI